MELARLITNYNESTEINKSENSLVEQACRLYLKALESLLVSESSKHNSFQQSLLENEHFHRSLLACSSETVLLIKDFTKPTFEEILEISRISVFDF
jgi:hypothetical protein